MKTKITFTIEAPENATESDVQNWVLYSLEVLPYISIENPLADFDIAISDIEIDKAK